MMLLYSLKAKEDSPMTVQCCVCKRIRDEGQWTKREDLGNGMISHTYCPQCKEVVLASFRQA